MRASDIPTKFNIPFGNSAGAGYIRTVPQGSQIGVHDGWASLADGFPPLNFLPLGSGGVPPFGQDMNGILNQISAWNRWNGGGCQATFDSTWSAAVGGYPSGALIVMAAGGGFWLCIADNNTNNPDTGGAGWIAFYPYQQQTLFANADYYVNPSTGSDSNNGLAASSGGGNGPWQTLQHAWSTIQSKLNLGGFTVTIHCATGTYSSFTPQGQIAGQLGMASIVFTGDTVTPSNCTINSSGDCVAGSLQSAFTIQGFAFVSASGSALYANNSNIQFASCSFGACAFAHLRATQFGYVSASGNYTITGGSGQHYFSDNATIATTSRTVTLTGTPSFVTAYASAENTGIINGGGMTFSGSATGPRYLATFLGGIITQNAGANYFPGNSAGSTNTGGNYF